MMTSKSILLCLLILLSVAGVVPGQNYHWEIVTNLNDIQKLHISGDTLFAASSGGLILYDLNNNSYDAWTAEDDLSDQHITAISPSPRNFYILGSAGGVLTYFNPRSQSIQEDLALDGNAIRAIHAIGDTMWVAADKIIAVYLFDEKIQKYSFRDFYTNFNVNIGEFTDIHYFGGRIWASSDVGLFSAPGDFIRNNLKAGESWKRMTTADGLPYNGLLSLESRNDSLFVGTQNGLSIYHDGAFFNSYTGLYGREIKEIIFRGKQVFVNNRYGVYRYVNNIFEPYLVTNAKNISSVEIDDNGSVWAGILENGLKNLSTGATIRFNGIIDNSVAEPLLDRHGRLWVVTGSYKDERKKGFSVKMPNGDWQNFRYLDDWRSTASAQGLLEDAEGNIWMGSWNGGFTIFDENLKPHHFNNYSTPGKLWQFSHLASDTLIVQPPDSLRHFFSHTQNAPDLLVVNDIVRDDARGRVWLITTAPQSGEPLISLNQNALNDSAYKSENWERISMPFGYNPNDLNASLTLDIFGNVWIGTEQSGVIRMQPKSDGTLGWLHLEEKDNLKNIRVWAIAGDQDGYVWIGTFGGLNAYFNNQLLNFSGEAQPIGIRINAIHVDGENNKWFATDKGISLLKASGSPWDVKSWSHFVPQNSESFAENIFHTNLPSEEIRGIFVDNNSGDVYCGTSSGLAILRNNPFTTPRGNLDQTKLGPNPFVIRDNQPNWFYLRNLTANSEIKILTASGRLVKNLNDEAETNILGSVARWNGRNSDGKLVSSGVYLFLVTDEDGNASQGKFVVIRK